MSGAVDLKEALAQAGQHLEEGRLVLAEHLCRAILAQRPHTPEASHLLARVRSDLGAQRALDRQPGRRNWAIVPGLLRDLPAFQHVINGLLRLRQEGLLDGIVVSTWHGQISSHPVVRQALDDLGIVWIENPEPPPNYCGHMLHQMLATHEALRKCPADAYVFKLRTDKVSINGLSYQDFRNALLHRFDLSTPSDLCMPRIFEQKILVYQAHLARFFFCPDQVFFGLRDDLLKLINFDMRYLFLFRNLFSEQWWFSRPFIERFEYMEEFFKAYPFFPNEITTRNFLAMGLANDFFVEALAIYLLILRNYFRIGFRLPDDPLYLEAVPRLREVTYCQFFSGTAAPFEFETMEVVAKTQRVRLTVPICSHDGWLDSVINGALAPDPLGERLCAAVEHFRQTGDWSIRNRAALADYAAQVRARFG